ncbi:carbohydrate binding domain-containing protein [Paenibacillus sp. NPDC101420]|uniref:hyaluronate lyase N-terminal domain-containing protein n=1 Tax=Paenibacillus sp. NPDC101420 TaxID=3390602 RepID=UPI003CFC40B6
MANKIQLMRGTKAQLTTKGGLNLAEPGYCTDTKDLYIGNDSGGDTLFLAADNIPYNLYRQAIINGNFDVWQRGTSVPHEGYVADRWRAYWTTGSWMPAVTRSRLALSATELPSSMSALRWTVAAGGAANASVEAYEFQAIENGTRYLCGAGRKVTVGFWAKSSISGKKIGLSLHRYFGNGGSPSTAEVIAGKSFTLTSTWAHYTHTFDMPTNVGKTFGTNGDDYLSLVFGLYWANGTQYGGATAEYPTVAGTIDFTRVVVSAGGVALPFNPRSAAEELALCQRYYEVGSIYASGGHFDGGFTRAQASTSFKVSKRTLPTMSFLNKSINEGSSSTNEGANYGGDSEASREIIAVTFPRVGQRSLPLRLSVDWIADAEI